MTAPAPRKEGSAHTISEITTLLGKGSDFEGKLTFEGAVRIEGKFKGEVFSDDVLVVGEEAYVEAEINIGEIIIQGTIVGNIRAKRAIEIRQPGRVKGDITTPSLQIERGVVFEGRSFMEEQSQKAQEKKPLPPHKGKLPAPAAAMAAKDKDKSKPLGK
ncbi:MAG: polymer-forming cytoskeletal protein [Proteobacteria bacterium]|nr:polymer-forming cytoskeletal protein [Pseudomonadota bacterium]